MIRIALLILLLPPLAAAQATGTSVMGSRPNILLIVSEDNGPELGCYGDPNSTTWRPTPTSSAILPTHPTMPPLATNSNRRLPTGVRKRKTRYSIRQTSSG